MVKFQGGLPSTRPHAILKNVHETQSSFRFQISLSTYVDIPAGSLWNGATIPWLFHLIFNPYDPRYHMATMMHDALVGEKGQPKAMAMINGVERELSWRESAKWFKLAMKVEPTYKTATKIHRELFYQAVMLKKRPGKLLRFFD